MLLTGPAINQALIDGSIHIDPFDPKQLNPASYDLRLGRECIVYNTSKILDTKTSNDFNKFEFDSMVLVPGSLYLLHTVEVISTDQYVTVVDGKSSLGRFGISIHQTAGYGDPGYNGQYTLEVTAIHPVRIYAGMRFCQARFHGVTGRPESYQDKGHYANRHGPIMGPIPSRAFRQFEDT